MGFPKMAAGSHLSSHSSMGRDSSFFFLSFFLICMIIGALSGMNKVA